jgi:hypothetical protein
MQGELEGWGAEDRSLLGELQFVGLPAVVEAWRAVQRQAYPAAHTPHRPDQSVATGCLFGVVDRHEVDHLGDAVRGHESGDQDGRVGEVELPGDMV